MVGLLGAMVAEGAAGHHAAKGIILSRFSNEEVVGTLLE
jgi:hypothetical protein